MLWQYRNDKKKLDFFFALKTNTTPTLFSLSKAKTKPLLLTVEKKNKKTTIEYQIVEPACILHWTKEYVCVTFSRVNE